MPSHALEGALHNAARWKTIFDHAFDAIVQMDANGCIMGWNTQAERCFGWFRHEVMGLPLHELALPIDRHQGHLHRLAQFIQQEADRETPTRVEIEGLHRTGHHFPMEMALAMVRTPEGIEFIAQIRDVSERHRTESALRIAATAFQTLEGLVVTDTHQRILKVNDAFSQITGYGSHEAVGKKSAIFRPERHDEVAYHSLHKRLPIDRFWQGKVWDRRKNGELYPARLRVTAVLDPYDHISHYVAAFVDTTERPTPGD